jgi:hypothetical protein
MKDTVLVKRYRLEERIGAGSMGAVWRATDELLGRTVAVKQLLLQPGSPGFDQSDPDYEQARQRILREGRLAARLQHPHAIAVFDAVVHDGAPWLVMEYLESRTLGAVLVEEGAMEPRRAADIASRAADGLAAAHAAGIVHRDIKPGNILIGADGVVKITDFGVSRANDDVQLTRTGMIAGTPAFLAPEVARGETPTVASDVFALGSTLYACVEGEPPFGLDENAYALLYHVGQGEVPVPAHAGPLTATLMWMLHRDPVRRPSAARARDELAAVAAGRGSPAQVTTGQRGAQETSQVGVAVAPAVASEAPVAAQAGPAMPVTLRTAPVPPPRGPSGPPPSAAGGDAAEPPGGSTGAPSPRAPSTMMLPPPVSAPTRGGRPGGAARSGFGAGAGSGLSRARTTLGGRRGRLLALAAAVLAVLVGVGVAVASSGSDVPPVAQAPQPAVTPSAPPVPPPTAQALPSTPPAATSEVQPAPSTQASPDSQPSRSDIEQFVRSYYSLLPGNSDKAWKMLGEKAQAESNGTSSYTRFYDSIRKISFAQGPTAVDDKTVQAQLMFEMKDGRTSGPERYQFVVQPNGDGDLQITSFSR